MSLEDVELGNILPDEATSGSSIVRDLNDKAPLLVNSISGGRLHVKNESRWTNAEDVVVRCKVNER